MIRKDVFVGTNSAYGVSAIYVENGSYRKELLALTFIERSKVLSKAISASIAEGYPVTVGSRAWQTKGNKYNSRFKPIRFGRDRFTLTTILNSDIGTRYLVTSEKYLEGDFYNYLMINYRLPLKTEWTKEIMDALTDSRLVLKNGRYNYYENNWIDRSKVTKLPGLYVHGEDVPVEDCIVYDFENLNDGGLTDIVSMLIKKGKIRVADVMSQPLALDSFDNYIKTNGKTIVDNLQESLEPLAPLSGELEGFAAKTKRLYPQQAACVNGIIALKKDNSQYGLMVEGMGCGKTLQGAAVADAYFNQKWLETHKGKDLKDLYMAEDQPKYRNVLMAPSHLIEKWKEEITSEVPGTQVTIIKDLDTLLKLRNEGKERKGREWYLISKDFAKLGGSLSPIPTNVAHMKPKVNVCADCLTDEDKPTVVYKDVKSKQCRRCGGRHFKVVELSEYQPVYGMVCPHCGNILAKPVNGLEKKTQTTIAEQFLTPADFASHTTTNDVCTLCGTHLWGVDSKPIGASEGDADKKKWYKVSHYKNFQKKGRTTAFVLKGHENEYLAGKEKLDIKKSPVEYGPRRYAPSLFIKKYLKGYFDFCVLDEAHKYEAGGSAQSIAAHALMKVSDFTLCLTGTITNGRADSLFYLLYMLDPRRMNKRGYKYSDVMDFSRQYGCIETVYESFGGEDEMYRSSSRGRVLSSPKVKPGISPLLFTDFLLDKAVFLDLSDLSKYLPPLKEQVVLVETPDDVRSANDHVMDELKKASREKGGRAVLSSMLQFGLAYPDKPYGFNPIMHPKFQDTKICDVPSCDTYQMGVLLPKEEKLIEIVNDEIGQDRNCFIYCAYTGAAEMNITGRLKNLVEERCNLKGQVLVMSAASPKATEREAYIHEQAAKGIRVFICNMKLVETGLDFCFKYKDGYYNYPSIIFYQLTYELAVMWQASRRHYRLNQKEECHTYYIANEGTLQQAAVQIMAEKQVAASAIQGKFSVDGLASMAKGIDPRVKLAQMLANEDDGMDRKSLENMFDVMNQANASNDDERYGAYVPPKTFYELMEGEKAAFETSTTETVKVEVKEPKKAVKTTEVKPKAPVKATTVKVSTGQMSLFDLADVKFTSVSVKSEGRIATSDIVPKKKPKKAVSGQTSLFDLFAA